MSLTPEQRARQQGQVEGHLDEGEQVLDVTFGALHEPRGRKDKARATSVIVTDRRVIFFRKKIGGYTLRPVEYGRISSVAQGKGLVAGELILVTDQEPVRVTSVPKDDVERIAGLIRERLTR